MLFILTCHQQFLIFSDNAMMAADYCIIVLQTQELSLDGAQTYIDYMQYLINTYNKQLQVLGIVPCMLRPGGRVDDKILNDAKNLMAIMY
ncbi:Uncharacterised protein [Pediococcus pentosaceus]|nr:Uncharacterised protein [Pediococcus pentosaceus]